MKPYLFCLLLLIVISHSHAQDGWEWGWSRTAENPQQYGHFSNTVNTPGAHKPFYGKLIWFYKKKISPVQSRRCPFYPSCSTFTLYSMQKYGFFMGLLMGIDRLYFRENVEVFRKIHYLSIRHNGEELAYDPPEANYIFGKKDWRIMDPVYYALFFNK